MPDGLKLTQLDALPSAPQNTDLFYIVRVGTGGESFKLTLADLLAIIPTGSGDVVGPASATDNALVRWDTTTGKLVQNGPLICDDSGNVTGLASMTPPGANLDVGAVTRTQGLLTGSATGFMAALDTNYNSGIRLQSFVDGLLRLSNGAGSQGVYMDFAAAADTFTLRNFANTGYGDLKLRNLIASGGNGVAIATVGTLPTTAATGQFTGACWVVTDALAPAIGGTVSAGGATRALVQWSGANWIVI